MKGIVLNIIEFLAAMIFRPPVPPIFRKSSDYYETNRQDVPAIAAGM